jgi:two-component system phosphate regulon sensor histidine kinase PhoR
MGFANSRIIWALTLVAVAAGIMVFTGGDMTTVLVGLVGGVAAVLVASDLGSRADAPADATPERTDEPAGDVIETLVEPVLIVRDGRIATANAAARALIGAHVVGEDARVAIRHPAAAEHLVDRDAPFPHRPIALVGLGSLDQHWEMRVAPTISGARVVHLTDQTANLAAERMRVDFVANASHELRTPLASILGYVETLTDEAGEDAAIRARFLKVMWDEARRMQRLVEDLISLSRIEAEKYRVPNTAVDIPLLVEDVCAEIRAGGSPRADDLVWTAPPSGLPPIQGDAAQLSQLVHNLIGNAMKYGRAGTPVTIMVTREGQMIRFAVTDEGDGIAAEHIPRLTERFYRVDAGRSRALGGTGLGLAIVKHIAERHRGRLDVTSKVGVGTTVSVTLPLGARAAG